MTALAVDHAIDRIARRQHGAFSYDQVRAAGGTSQIVRRRLSLARWLELDYHVYALPSSAGTWQRQCMAASLAVNGGAVSDGSAAALHGLCGFRPGSIHVVVCRSTNQKTRLATVRRSGWPRTTTVSGVPVVTMADTFFQIAGRTAPARLRAAFQDAVMAHGSLLSQLADRYVDLVPKRLPGIERMRELLAEHDDDGVALPQTELERLLDALLDEIDGLPPRQRQAPLPGWDRAEARVDVLVEDWRLILEADGRRWHARVDDFERDRWRDNLAATHGYQVLRFTHRQLTSQRDETLALLRRYARTRSVASCPVR